MPTYTIRADVADGNLQNDQDRARTWGEATAEIERLGGELVDAYAVLGDHDFRFTYEADDAETAMRISVAVERLGLDTRTEQLVGMDRLGDLVEDI